MKWKNIDTGAGYYCVTGTITQWLPLFSREEMRRAVCYEINVALRRFGGSMCAYVIMPDHLQIRCRTLVPAHPVRSSPPFSAFTLHQRLSDSLLRLHAAEAVTAGHDPFGVEQAGESVGTIVILTGTRSSAPTVPRIGRTRVSSS